MNDATTLLNQIIDDLKQLTDDTTVPRNIRKGAQDAVEAMKNEAQDVDVRAASAISILDELANDPNLPIHARTVIWGILSKLEALCNY